MKTFRILATAAIAMFAAASCQKNQVSDAIVSFESESYSFYLEDGPNYDVPIKISGNSIAYPITVTVTDVASDDEEVVYNERNVDWRFIDQKIVINSADETPVVTVRCYNAELEEFRFKIGIEAVDNGGQAGAIKETEIIVRTQVAAVAGSYTAKGKLSKNDGTTDYSETWTFMTDGTMVGFTGLLGEDAMSDENTWPIIGDGYKIAEGANAGKVGMTFVLGLENYINAYEFNGIGVCYLAPGIVTGNDIFLDGLSLVMEQTDDNSIKMAALTDGSTSLPLDESYSITYALYSYETEEFIGYTYGGEFFVEGNTVTRTTGDTPSGYSAASRSLAEHKAVLTNVRTGETVIVDMSPVNTDRNVTLK